jgi:6-phosphogluconate dehydrogenase
MRAVSSSSDQEGLSVKSTSGRMQRARATATRWQKGTGRWTAVAALEQGQPLTLITEEVSACALSSTKETRERAAAILPGSYEV